MTELNFQKESAVTARYKVLRIVIYTMLLFSLFACPCFALDIYVDQKNGSLENCCHQHESCKTFGLAFQCLQQNNHTTVWIKPDTYYLEASDESISGVSTKYEFNWMQDIAIVALREKLTLENSTSVLVVCSDIDFDKGAGLVFLNSVNITIQGIMFDGCGVYHNSTSWAEGTTFFQFFATLYFMQCVDVTLNLVHVNGTNGIGTVMYSTVGYNRISNCIFSYNAVKSSNGIADNIPGGGGLYIEYCYCLPISGSRSDPCDKSTNIPPHFSQNSLYEIEFTSFYKNNATVAHTNDLTFILPHLSNHIAFGRGGGLSVFFKGNAFNNTIRVSNSMFTENEALWGGGLFVEYQDNVQNNTFEIRSSTISSNLCHGSESESKGTGGGGARIGYIFFNSSCGSFSGNNMTFSGVHFDNNKAYFGGGLSFYTAREPTSPYPTNYLSFSDCRWENNVARVGSAADISVWHPVPSGAVVKPSFTSCVFINNSASYTNTPGVQVGLGAVYVDSIPVTFIKDVQFISNTHTSLSLLSTGIYFEEGCHAYFALNRGRNGGAIALMANSFFTVSKNTKMVFVNNSADLKGGAIFGQSIGEHDLISSRNCFIRYENIEATALNWSATFKFENNTVANGHTNSIHVTSLLTCLWGGAFGSTETIKAAAEKVFCWNNESWIYSMPCSQEISTSPAHFASNDYLSLPTYNAKVIPGMKTPIDISIFDDRENNVTNEAVFTARLSPLDVSNNISLDGNSLYISDNTFKLYGQPGQLGTLKLETIEPRVITTEINVTLQECPPGMYHVGHDSSASCQCGVNSYSGYIICHASNFSAEILRGSWIGYDSRSSREVDSELLVGQCPYCASLGSELYISLPHNFSMLSEYMCNKIHRTGELCGRCVQGYGPVVNGDFECIPCSPQDAKYHWLLYLLSEFLPIFFFFMIVVFFNVSVTSGPANGFVYFAQVITIAFSLTGDGAVQIKELNTVISALTYIYSVP